MLSLVLPLALGYPNYAPPCQCDAFYNGASAPAKGQDSELACMVWAKNNPHLKVIKEAHEKLPGSPGEGYLMACQRPQGNGFECPGNGRLCTVDWQAPAFMDAKTDPDPCECTHFVNLNGVNPTDPKAHMCMTATKLEKWDDPRHAVDGKKHVCTPSSTAYENRFGESYANWGCDHPAVPCSMAPKAPV